MFIRQHFIGVRIAHLVATFSILILAATGMSQSSSPAPTVKDFYKFSDAHSDLFNRRHIELRKRWYTPRLYRIFREELQRQTDMLKSHPTDKPFFGDGLDFRPRDEKCQANGRTYGFAQMIGEQFIRHNVATVEVRWAYPLVCHDGPVRYRLVLRKVGGRWLIDDLIYDDGSSLALATKNHRY